MVIGIDHGYYAIKTKQVCFPTGIIRYEYEPYTMQNVLQYQGEYYVCGTGRQTLVKDKTANDNYYLLTLAALAQEIRKRKGKTLMAEMKNICGKIPVELHEKVRAEIEERETSTQIFIRQVIEEHFNRLENKGEESMEKRTLAVQVTEELFQRVKWAVTKEGIKQKDFIIRIIEKAVEEVEAKWQELEQPEEIEETDNLKEAEDTSEEEVVETAEEEMDAEISEDEEEEEIPESEEETEEIA